MSRRLRYFSTLTRGWELGVGALLALAAPSVGPRAARRHDLLVPLGLGGIAISTLAYSATTPFPGYAALLPVASTAMILAAGIERRRSSLAVRLLESRPFVAVGDVSYSFYLWHWPVLVIAAQYVGHPLSLAANLTLVGLALAISVLTTRWFEDPIRHSKRLAPSRLGLVLWPVTVSLTLLVVASSAHAINERLDQLAASIQPEAQAAATRRVQHQAEAAAPRLTPAEALVAWSASQRRGTTPVPNALSPLVQDLAGDIFPLGDCGASGSDTSSNVCRFGDTTANRMIGVYGDSHAQMWMPGIIRYARNNDYAVVPLTKDGCATAKWLHPEPGDDCARWSTWAIGRLRNLHPDLIIVGESYSDAWRAGNGPQAEGGLTRELAALRRITPRVVLIGDPPNLSREPTDCLLADDATLASARSRLPTQPRPTRRAPPPRPLPAPPTCRRSDGSAHPIAVPPSSAPPSPTATPTTSPSPTQHNSPVHSQPPSRQRRAAAGRIRDPETAHYRDTSSPMCDIPPRSVSACPAARQRPSTSR